MMAAAAAVTGHFTDIRSWEFHWHSGGNRPPGDLRPRGLAARRSS